MVCVCVCVCAREGTVFQRWKLAAHPVEWECSAGWWWWEIPNNQIYHSAFFSWEQLDLIAPLPRRDERQKTQMPFTLGSGGAPNKCCWASSAVVQQSTGGNQMSPQLFVPVATYSTYLGCKPRCSLNAWNSNSHKALLQPFNTESSVHFLILSNHILSYLYPYKM